MSQLGLIIQKDQIIYLYADHGRVVFSQTGGDFSTWAKDSGIAMDAIASILVQKDFCEDLSAFQAQEGYCKLEMEDLVQTGLLWNQGKVKMTLEELRQRQLETFEQADQMTPDTELIRNQTIRENYLSFNLLLSKRAKDFVDRLTAELEHMNCRAKIYFLRGSGYLTDAKNTMKNPVLTWRSKEALELLSAAAYHKLDDFIYLKRRGNEYFTGVVKDGGLVTYQNHCSLNGYELPPWFVKTKWTGEKDWEDEVAFLKQSHGDLPIVLEGELRTREMAYYRYAGEKNPFGGLFQVPYRKRIFRQIVMEEETMVKEAEHDLQRKMDYYLANNQVDLRNPVLTMSRENLQYSLDRIVRLELRVVGLLEGK